MREIGLCRAQDYNHRWWRGYHTKEVDGDREYHSLTLVDGNVISVKKETIGEYIGYDDINNNKIFEHHIVQIKTGRKCKVVWISGRYHNGFDLVGLDDKYPKGNEAIYQDLTIVGCVIDTPDLLEVSDAYLRIRN